MANKQYIIGVDVGGTNMKAVLFDGKNIIDDYLLATPKDDLDHFLIMLKALIEPLEERAKKDKVKIKGLGIGIAGVIDYEEGKMLESPNISILDNIKIYEKIKERINLPIKIDNDANCFLRAEMKLGAGTKFNNAYGIIIGTGIGGAWWNNNKIYQGAHGGGGEPGRMIINFREPIELEETYKKLLQNNPAKMANEAYRADPLAEKTFKEVGNILGIALANIVNLIDPEIIIVGGGVVDSSDLFLNQTKKTMKKYIMSNKSKKIKIVKGKLEKDAGCIGAALLWE